MKLFLLCLLVVGVLSKDKTIKDKDSANDLLYKDSAVLNLGDANKLKIHQRLSTINIDLTKRHYIDDVLVNIDRCFSICKDDYNVNKDVSQYRMCIGNLMGMSLGQFDFFDRNNLWNDGVDLDNLVNRFKQCDTFIRDVNFNTYNKLDWRDNVYNLLGVRGVLGTYGGERDIYTRDLSYLNNVLGGGLNRGVGVDRGYYGRGVGGVDRGDIYGRGVGGSSRGDVLGRGDSYGRGFGGIDRGDAYGYGRGFGGLRDDVYGRGDDYGRGDFYGRGFGYGRGLGGVGRSDYWGRGAGAGAGAGGADRFGNQVGFGRVGGGGNDWNADRTYGRFVRSSKGDDKDDNKSDNTDQGNVGWYRIIYGIINDDDVNNDDINQGGYNVNRYVGSNSYGPKNTYGYGYGYRGYNDADSDVYGRRNFFWNRLIGGEDRDIYGYRGDVNDYNVDRFGRTYNNVNDFGGRRFDTLY